MPTIYSNHLTVTGPSDRLGEFSRWCGINEGMFDVDDGAAGATRFGIRTNYHNHKRFIDFIKTETDTCVDRIRLHRCRDGGFLMCLDSWHVDFGRHTQWMAENFPDLVFDVDVIQDGHCHWQVVFEQGKWVEMFHQAPMLKRPRRWLEMVRSVNAVGYYGDYSEPSSGQAVDVDAIDDEDLRELARKYRQDARTDYEQGERRFHEQAIGVDEIGVRYGDGIVSFRVGDDWGVGYSYDVIEDMDAGELRTNHLPPDHVVPMVLEFSDPDIFVGLNRSTPVCIGRRGDEWGLFRPWGTCLGTFPTKQSAIDQATQMFGQYFRQATKEAAD